MSFVPLPPLLLPIPTSGPSPTPTTVSSLPLPSSKTRRMIALPLESGCAVDWALCKVRSCVNPPRTMHLHHQKPYYFPHLLPSGFLRTVQCLFILPIPNDYSIIPLSCSDSKQVDIGDSKFKPTWTSHIYSFTSIHYRLLSNALNVVASPTVEPRVSDLEL
jgi:hypothetical protein